MNPRTPDNEVSRLRESLVKMIQRNNKLEMELSKAEARLAPAPEETQDGATMKEWYGGFSKIESTEPSNPTCSNTTHKFSHCDCREPVSLDSATKITHEGNTDAKFKQLHEVASIIVEYIEDPDRRKHYRSEIQQLTPATEETSEKDTSTETCPSQKDTEWRELGADEVICEGDEIQWPYKDWQTAKSSIGYKVGYWDGLVKGRTRRPLPKQEEMPLEKELEYLTREASRAADIHNHVLIVDCLRYLRDEIQKLNTKIY